MQLENLLLSYNRWWQNGKVPKVLTLSFKRRLYDAVFQEIENGDRIVSIAGPRRVGKTTMIYQLIEDLISRGKSPQDIIYLSCDHPSINGSVSLPDDLLEHVERYILREAWSDTSRVLYIFLDEIQKVPQWAETLKTYYDLKLPVRFVVSGSAGVDLITAGRESLAGRVREFVMPILSFAELYAWETGSDPVPLGPERLFAGSLPETVTEAYHNLRLEASDIRRRLDSYLVWGGYPYVYSLQSSLERWEYIEQSVFEKIIYQDIPAAFGVKNMTLLKEMMLFLAAESSGLVSLSKLSAVLPSGAKITTVGSYLEYLEKSFMAVVLPKYSLNMLSTLRANRKVHIGDTGMANALLRRDESLLPDADAMGRVAETATALNLAFNPLLSLFYWRDGRYEIDLVLRYGTEILPVEVKYRHQIRTTDLASMYAFLERFHSSCGIVITEDIFEIRDNIMLIPLWMWLLLV